MKLVTFTYNGRTAIGAVLNDQIIDLSRLAPDMQTFIESGKEGLAAAQAATVQAATANHTIPLTAVHLLAPIPTPRRNVICLGLNYSEHVKESYGARGQQAQLPETPVVFTKATTAVAGPTDPIPYDPAVTTQLDWEVELAVIIGRAGKNIPADEAMDYVFGYTVLNDISARDLQMAGKQYFKGKSLDGACPTGPWIVTADELPDPHNLRLTCRVNGVTKQDGRTNIMIFNILATIAYLSRGMTLLPGDIIATGTPDGVGFARTPPEFLQPGDVVESEIEGIGVLRNPVAPDA
ncbi:MAG TPA: fumarylacetoacetate hydrolase family protein [Chloroflexota bacterium]|nr:fumarylacetoacetate hydrolase family protein [Chloroflexota bacterium]